jgi:disulfide bond formation protein DsbB
MTTTAPAPTGTAAGIDPRGPRLTAGITALVLVTVLLLPSPWAAVLTGVQAVLFAIGAARGVQHTPHAWLFRTVVRPRLSPPGELEDPAPPRFAQGVGLAFTIVALVALVVGQGAAGVTLVGQVAIGFALVAALLNAVFGLCLGCEIYLILTRFSAAR